MEESERDAERANSGQEKKESDQSRQNKGLLLSHGRGLGMKSLTENHKVILQMMPQAGPHNGLKYHLFT